MNTNHFSANWPCPVAGRAGVSILFLGLASLLWSGCAAPSTQSEPARRERVGPAVEQTGSLTGTAEPETTPEAGEALASVTGAAGVKPEAQTQVALASFDGLEQTWGVKILGVRLSAAGHLLDFRYRVTDPEKAVPLFHRKTKPYLVDEASGARLAVPNPPKVGPLRAMSRPEADRVYFVLFSNPGAYLQRGSRVTVAIGDFRAEHLAVQ